MSTYQLQNIQVSYGERTVLKLPELSLHGDRLTVILGHNGSGKSTLMSLLAQQNSPTSGHLQLNNQPLSSYSARQFARQVAFMPQHLPGTSGLTVRELVELGRFPWRGMLGRLRAEDHQAVEQALIDTETVDYADTLVDQLSGGERQRAWVAMLLAQEAPVLLLDEPTSALDIAHQYDLLKLLRQLNRQRGCGIMIILHDLNMALRFADEIVALKKGELVFQGKPEAMSDETQLSNLYNVPIRVLNHPEHNTPIAVIA